MTRQPVPPLDDHQMARQEKVGEGEGFVDSNCCTRMLFYLNIICQKPMASYSGYLSPRKFCVHMSLIWLASMGGSMANICRELDSSTGCVRSNSYSGVTLTHSPSLSTAKWNFFTARGPCGGTGIFSVTNLTLRKSSTLGPVKNRKDIRLIWRVRLAFLGEILHVFVGKKYFQTISDLPS